MAFKKISAGLLMYKFENKELKILLVHPGGPYFVNKDIWGIPKGELKDKEDPFEAAKREFYEEVGIKPHGKFISLGSIKQKSGKIVYGWAFNGDLKEFKTRSFFKIEWPPKSGEIKEFPEIDKTKFFPLKASKEKIMPEQFEFIKRLIEYLKQN